MNKNNDSNSVATVGHVMNTEQLRWLLLGVAMLSLVVASALAVIYSTYKNRQLFSELQQQNRETMRLGEEWGRLLLEQSTWVSHERIERLAKTQLKMKVPDPKAIIVVKK